MVVLEIEACTIFVRPRCQAHTEDKDLVTSDCILPLLGRFALVFQVLCHTRAHLLVRKQQDGSSILVLDESSQRHEQVEVPLLHLRVCKRRGARESGAQEGRAMWVHSVYEMRYVTLPPSTDA
jgi:hypothetical protein